MDYLWVAHERGLTLTERVSEACEVFRERFGGTPALVVVSDREANAPELPVDAGAFGVRVEGSAYVAPGTSLVAIGQ